MIHSIVVPVHNEAGHLEPSVDRFLEELSERAAVQEYEVLLVENGSTDGTPAVCDRLAERLAGCVRVLSIPRGSYGEAIKHGMLESKGRYVTILECDVLSVDFLLRSREVLESGCAQLLVGSKRHPDSRDRRPLKRRLLTAAFNRIVNLAIGYPGSDTHGLKSVNTDLARELCAHAQTTDEIFQTEIVLIAWRLGNTIGELPIEIAETRPTPVPILSRLPALLDMIRELRRSARRFPGRDARAPVRL